QDPQLGVRAGGYDRCQLRTQRAGSVEQDLDPARRGIAQEWRRLVPAEIEEADRRGPATEVRKHGAQDAHLLVESRPGRRLQEKQLAAQQPDTLCSLLRRLSQLSMCGGVREHANGATVFGLRRLEAARDRDLASRATTTGVVAREGDSLGVGPADHDAAIAVDNDLLPICD